MVKHIIRYTKENFEPLILGAFIGAIMALYNRGYLMSVTGGDLPERILNGGPYDQTFLTLLIIQVGLGALTGFIISNALNVFRKNR
jgi:hypothetical protein